MRQSGFRPLETIQRCARNKDHPPGDICPCVLLFAQKWILLHTLPAAHVEHSPPRGPVYPALQKHATTDALPSCDQLLAGQVAHEESPASLLYLPAAHATQLAAGPSVPGPQRPVDGGAAGPLIDERRSRRGRGGEGGAGGRRDGGGGGDGGGGEGGGGGGVGDCADNCFLRFTCSSASCNVLLFACQPHKEECSITSFNKGRGAHGKHNGKDTF